MDTLFCFQVLQEKSVQIFFVQYYLSRYCRKLFSVLCLNIAVTYNTVKNIQIKASVQLTHYTWGQNSEIQWKRCGSLWIQKRQVQH